MTGTMERLVVNLSTDWCIKTMKENQIRGIRFDNIGWQNGLWESNLNKIVHR